MCVQIHASSDSAWDFVIEKRIEAPETFQVGGVWVGAQVGGRCAGKVRHSIEAPETFQVGGSIGIGKVGGCAASRPLNLSLLLR